MRFGIFYFGLTSPKAELWLSMISLPGGGTGYIRVEEVQAENVMEALDKANPRPHEMVMNSHPLEQDK